MIFPVISAQLGAALLALQIVLMLNTGLYRAKIGQFIGQGEDPHMIRRIRRHGNLAENAALFVVVIALAELIGLSSTGLVWIASGFFLVRVAHAIGFSSLTGSHGGDGSKFFIAMRIIGAFGTAILGLGLTGWIFASFLLG